MGCWVIAVYRAAELAGAAQAIVIVTVTAKLSTAGENIAPMPYCSQRANIDLVWSNISARMNSWPRWIAAARHWILSGMLQPE